MWPSEDGAHNAAPVEASCVSHSSPAPDRPPPSSENYIAGRRGSRSQRRASSPPTALGDEASSAPASSLPSVNCSRPITAADWATPSTATSITAQGTWQPAGPGLAAPGPPPFLSAVVHSGTTTTLGGGMPPIGTSPWRSSSGHVYGASALPTAESATAGDAVTASDSGALPPPPGPTTDLLTAAAARLIRQKTQPSHPCPSPPPQQQPQQQQRQQRRGPEQQQGHPGPCREASPPAPQAGSHPTMAATPGVVSAAGLALDVTVPWDAGRLSPAAAPPSSTAGGGGGVGSSAGSPSLLANELLLPYMDVLGSGRQLGARRVPSVVLEPSSRRLPASREAAAPMTPSGRPRSPGRLWGDGASPSQHAHPGSSAAAAAAFALAPLPSPFASHPSSAAAAARADYDEGGADAAGRGQSPHQRKRYSATTVSFTRPSTVTFQPITAKLRSPTGAPAAVTASASAPLPSAAPPPAPLAAAAATAPASPQKSPQRTSFPPFWGYRPTRGSSPRRDADGSDQGLGLWHHHNAMAVRVTTVVPTLADIERADTPNAGLTHVVHNQHMRHSALAASASAARGGSGGGLGAHFGGGGGGSCGGSPLGGMSMSCSVDLTGSLRRNPQFQQYLQQHRQHKMHVRQQQQQQQQPQEQQQQQEQQDQLPSPPPPQQPQNGQGPQQRQPPRQPQQPSLSRSMSVVLLPSMPRFTPLPQLQVQPPTAAGTHGSPHARQHRRPSVLGSAGADSRPSTSPPSPQHSRSPLRSPAARSPSRSPPRSPGRNSPTEGVAGTGMPQPAPAPAVAAVSEPAAASTGTSGTAGAAGAHAAEVGALLERSRQGDHTHGGQPQPHPQGNAGQQQPVAGKSAGSSGSTSRPADMAAAAAAAPPPPAATASLPDVDSGAADGGDGGEARRALGKAAPPPQGHRKLLPYSAAETPILTVGSHSPKLPSHGGLMYGTLSSSREGLPGRSPGRRMPGSPGAKEYGGLVLLAMHPQQHKHQLQHQHQLLQQQLQRLEAETGASTFSLRRTAYDDWVEGAPLVERRGGGGGGGGGAGAGGGGNGGGGGGGGVVAGGLEGKAVVLRRQPLERGAALYFQPANRKPLLGGDVLHVL
ncbi:hypothetical protein PLESTB_000900500 [Pleodorina starrii]|uniref:Uncharacterized protein n=1 Tax=Pleodorina starrii TaxID=330485 RepID=A0A9W6F3E4_9CHLO|nr:hypothetical protein PLESTM_001563400 [Pleodorina starrii]GLC54734.1 hypothetical protein PLESTB_000900500 [Pleodorina starrii]